MTLAAAVFAVSCEEEGASNGTFTVADGSTFSPVFTAAAGEQVINFNCTADWEVVVPNTNSYSWSAVTPTSGEAGDASVSVLVIANDNTEDRSYTFDLRSGNTVQTVTVLQKAKGALTLAKNVFEVGKDGEQISIDVTANVDYSYEIAEDAKEWIVFAGTKSLETSSLLFNVAANEVFEPRTGTITITAEGLSETVTVKQAANELVFEVSPEKLEFDIAGGTKTFSLDCNVEYGLYVWADWFTVKDNGDKTFTVNVTKNEGFAGREAGAYIYIYEDTEDETYLRVSISQKGQADVNLAWSKSYSADLTSVTPAQPTRLAVCGDYLLVANGTSKVAALDRKTGAYVTTVSVPGDVAVASMTNDDAGHVIFSAGAAFNATMDVYYMSSLTDTPKKLFSYPHTSVWSSNIGNLRVRGDVTKEAAVASFVDVSQYYVVWQITGGVADSGTFGAITPATGTVWNYNNSVVVPASSSLSDGVYFIGYTGDYNLHYCASPLSDKTWASVFTSGLAGNEIVTGASTATYDGKKFLAYVQSAAFSYSSTGARLVDVTDKSSATDCGLYGDDYVETNYVGTGYGADVVLYVDGGTMYMYFTDIMMDYIACVSFKAE